MRSLFLLLSLSVLSTAACGARVVNVLDGDDGSTALPDGGGGDGAPAGDAAPEPATDSGSSDCESRGGVCLPEGESAPPTYRRAGAGEASCGSGAACWLLVTPEGDTACTIDAECNPSPTISTLYGSCFQGICVCKTGYHVQPNGKCAPAVPGDCKSQGGSCVTIAGCATGQVEGTAAANLSCGDFAPAVCCYRQDTQPSQCKGPSADSFQCCAPNDASHLPVCESGWITCPADHAPVKAGVGCG